MDIRTLTFVNLIFLFLYAAFITINSAFHGRIRGGTCFVLSNISRGLAGIFFALSAFLPRSLSTIGGDILLVVGLTLLHRSFAELLGRPRTAWKLQLAVTAAVAVCVAWSTLVYGSYIAALIVVSIAFAIQLALTTSLLLSEARQGIRAAVWLTGSILLLYAAVEMTRAIILLRAPYDLRQIGPALISALLIGALLANGGTAFGFLFLSASQLRRELIVQAEHDALTGVLNRRGLHAVAERHLIPSHRAFEPVSVVSLDLDGMKTANDTWGHDAGDAMLRAVAGALVNTIGDRGAVARLGGDEFVVVLPGVAEGGAYEIAETLRRSIERLRVPHCRPRASFGVASMNGYNWQDAIRMSDQALIQAKTEGRNRVIAYA